MHEAVKGFPVHAGLCIQVIIILEAKPVKKIFPAMAQRFEGLGMFTFLWSGQTLSGLGSAMTRFALILWVYKQDSSALSVSLLSVCSLAPSVMLSMLAGAMADRWNKKRTMLVCDAIAAAGSLAVLILIHAGRLLVWHLYIIEFVMGVAGAFQDPAASVATTLLVPRDQYTRIGGMQAMSRALNSLLPPVFATALLSFTGIEVVILVDLIAFAYAFVTLGLFISIPPVAAREKTAGSLMQSCLEGLRFLRKNRPLLQMILFFACINLLVGMTGSSMLSAMLLGRTGGNDLIVGTVSSMMGLGYLLGSLMVTILPPPRNRMRLIFFCCAMAFAFSGVPLGLGRSLPVWLFAAIAGNLPQPFMNANIGTVMRLQVPLEMQGRVFSTRDTLQYTTIPIGYLLAGVLADKVFAPLLAGGSAFGRFCASLVGTGKGAEIALVFLLVGIVGALTNLLNAFNPRYTPLNND